MGYGRAGGGDDDDGICRSVFSEDTDRDDSGLYRPAFGGDGCVVACLGLIVGGGVQRVGGGVSR